MQGCPKRTATRSAPIVRRVAALLYDALLIVGLLFPITAVLLVFRSGKAFPAGDPLYLALIALTVVCFYVGFWVLGGQTPGMRAWRIRLEDTRGMPPRAREALVYFGWAALLTMMFGLGWWWTLFNPARRSLQERLTEKTVRRVP